MNWTSAKISSRFFSYARARKRDVFKNATHEREAGRERDVQINRGKRIYEPRSVLYMRVWFIAVFIARFLKESITISFMIALSLLLSWPASTLLYVYPSHARRAARGCVYCARVAAMCKVEFLALIYSAFSPRRCARVFKRRGRFPGVDKRTDCARSGRKFECHFSCCSCCGGRGQFDFIPTTFVSDILAKIGFYGT